jgi:hypothetical protein
MLATQEFEKIKALIYMMPMTYVSPEYETTYAKHAQDLAAEFADELIFSSWYHISINECFHYKARGLRTDSVLIGSYTLPLNDTGQSLVFNNTRDKTHTLRKRYKRCAFAFQDARKQCQ